MAKDALDRETSVSFALTQSGVKAKTQSRFVAAVDRFGGNIFELINAPIERRVARQRAIGAGETKFIEAAAKSAIEQLKYDPEFAQRAAQNYFSKVIDQQKNKDAVLAEALDDLRRDPPDDNGSEDHNLEIGSDLLGRLEYYAGGASSEEIRLKWGRVLSAEVRKPGTFSLKVLRIVDEMDPAIAALFERVCKSRVGDAIPTCLVELSYEEAMRLAEADLFMEPSDLVRKFKPATSFQGKELWGQSFGRFSIGFSKDVSLPVELNKSPS